MPEEGLDWLEKESLLTDDEVVRLIRIGVELLGVTEVRFTGGEPLLRRGLVDIVRRTAALEPRPETSLTTNALGPGPDRRGARGGRPRPGQRQPGHGPAGHLPDHHPPGPPRRRRRRSRGGEGRRARAGQGQRGPAARRQRRPGARAAGVVPRARLRAALHRADAAGRPARLGPGRDGHRRRDPRVAGDPLRAHAGRGAAGERPCRAVGGRRRPGHGRCHRLGHPAVLRRLRPGPAHRRRPGPQLPVRPRRVRPAHRPCGPAPTTRRSPTAG